MFNFQTPEEKVLIKRSAGVFAQAHEFTHEGVAGNIPVWGWPGSGAGEQKRPGVLLLHGWGGEAGLMGAFVKPLLDLG